MRSRRSLHDVLAQTLSLDVVLQAHRLHIVILVDLANDVGAAAIEPIDRRQDAVRTQIASWTVFESMKTYRTLRRMFAWDDLDLDLPDREVAQGTVPPHNLRVHMRATFVSQERSSMAACWWRGRRRGSCN